MSQQPQQRRSRRGMRAMPSVGTVVTTAAVAYGTYKLADWVWNQQYHCSEEEEEEEDEDQRCQQQQQSLSSTISSSISDWLFGNSPQPSEGGDINNRNPNGFFSRRMNKQQQWKEQRRRVAMCREETQKVYESFLPIIRRMIEDYTSTNKETKELKKLRSKASSPPSSSASSSPTTVTAVSDNNVNDTKLKEKELWEIIKVNSFTRLVSTATAHTILFLVLTVQIHLVAGKLWEQERKNNGFDPSSSSSTSSSHRRVLMKTYDYFLDHGIRHLIRTIERAVDHVVAEWDVTDPSSLRTTKTMVDDALSEILQFVLYGRSPPTTTKRSRSRRPRSLLRYLVPFEDDDCNERHHQQQEGLASVGVGDATVNSILDETWDLLESPVLEDALQESLDCTFALMRDRSWGTIFDSDTSIAYEPTRTPATKSSEPSTPSSRSRMDSVFDASTPLTETTNEEKKQDIDGENVRIDKDNDEILHAERFDEDTSTVSLPTMTTSTDAKPLAQILAQFKHASNSFYRETALARSNSKTTENPKWIDYIHGLQNVPAVRELGDVSFEAMF